GSGDHQEIVAPPLIAGLQPHRLGTRLRSRTSRLSVWLRLSLVEGDAGAVLEVERLLESVDGAIDVVSISLLAPEAGATRGGDIRGTWRRLLSVCREHRVSTVLVDYPRSNPLSAIQPALDAGAGGLVIRSAAEHLQTGDIRTAVQQARRAVASPGLVVVADGARSPRDVVEAFAAGADLVAVDQGFIEAGPGLARRSNEALDAMRTRAASSDMAPGPPPSYQAASRSGWLWLLLLGLGMLIAGAVVFWIGLTRVLLPYDEAFLGAARDRLDTINPQLLGVMLHDWMTPAESITPTASRFAALACDSLRYGHAGS